MGPSLTHTLSSFFFLSRSLVLFFFMCHLFFFLVSRQFLAIPPLSFSLSLSLSLSLFIYSAFFFYILSFSVLDLPFVLLFSLSVRSSCLYILLFFNNHFISECACSLSTY